MDLMLTKLYDSNSLHSRQSRDTCILVTAARRVEKPMVERQSAGAGEVEEVMVFIKYDVHR